MASLIETHEALFRFGIFAAVFVAMALLEAWRPRRTRSFSRKRRWLSNIAIVVLDTVLLRIALPLMAVDMALMAERNGWGLFNVLGVPGPLEVLLSILILDAVIYWQHVAFHRVPLLWRLHQVHHTDRDLDASSALRFHPIEIILSMVLKMAVVVLLGASALAVILFEVILNAMAMFNHANLALPPKFDGWLRRVVVTPDMHRVHHSTLPREFNSNFGFNLSLWDRLFSSYTAAPSEGHTGMTLGQKRYLTDEPTQLTFMLFLPFWRNRS